MTIINFNSSIYVINGGKIMSENYKNKKMLNLKYAIFTGFEFESVGKIYINSLADGGRTYLCFDVFDGKTMTSIRKGLGQIPATEEGQLFLLDEQNGFIGRLDYDLVPENVLLKFVDQYYNEVTALTMSSRSYVIGSPDYDRMQRISKVFKNPKLKAVITKYLAKMEINEETRFDTIERLYFEYVAGKFNLNDNNLDKEVYMKRRQKVMDYIQQQFTTYYDELLAKRSLDKAKELGEQTTPVADISEKKR